MRWNEFPSFPKYWLNRLPRSVYNSGQRIVDLDWVEYMGFEMRPDGVFLLEGGVRSSSQKDAYRVQCEMSHDGDITDGNCECLAFAETGRVCKHIVALLIKYQYFCERSVMPTLRRNNGNAKAVPGQKGVIISESGFLKSLPTWSKDPAAREKARQEMEERLRKEREEEEERKRQEEERKRQEEERKKVEEENTQANELLDAFHRHLIGSIRAEVSVVPARQEAALVPVVENIDGKFYRGVKMSFQIRAVSPGEKDEPAAEEGSLRVWKTQNYPRSYIIKNVFEFLEQLRYSAVLNFGKDLSFRPGQDSFDEASGRVVKMLEKESGIFASLSELLEKWPKDGRNIVLSNRLLDEIFELYRGRKVKCADGDPHEYYSLFDGGMPDVAMSIAYDSENKTAELTFRNHGDVFTGSRYTDCYVFRPSSVEKDRSRARYVYVLNTAADEAGVTRPVIRRYTKDASDALRPVFDALLAAQGRLVFRGQQLSDFAAHILPVIRKYLSVDVPESMTFSTEVPDVMEGQVFLDAPDRDTVLGISLAGYNGTLIDIATGQPVGTTREAGEKVDIDWDTAGLSADNIRRDRQAELRFLAQTGGAMGVSGADMDTFISEVEDGFKKGGRSPRMGSREEPFRLKDSDGIYHFLTEGVKKLSEHGRVMLSDRMKRFTVTPPRQAKVGVTLNSGLLNIKIDSDVDIDEYRRLLRAYHEKKSYYRLKDGSFIDLKQAKEEDAEGWEMLEEIGQGLQMDGDGREMTVPAFRAMYLDGLFGEDSALSLDKNDAFKNLTERIRNFSAADIAIPEKFDSILRPYQKTGFKWLRTMENCSFCGILADDMGLGKSVQIISLLYDHYAKSADGEESLPTLIVSPASLVLNWKQEMEKFAPEMPVRIIQGTAAARKILIGEISPREVVLTSYDLLKRDIEQYKGHPFRYVVIDEAQNIKNHTTQAAKAVKQVVCRQRFALTGTPIENRLSELWSIFDFLMPGYLYKYTRFAQQFERPIAKENDAVARENLKRMIRPFVLRRLKTDVLTDLPPKTTTVIPVEMEEKQKEIYQAAVVTGLRALKSTKNRGEGVAKMQVLALLTRLRRLCCDPTLCFEDYKNGSAKLEACLELLRQAKDGGHRVLLFSQYTDMLDILEKRLQEENMTMLRLQGSTPPAERVGLVDRFNGGEGDVFLISLKAGGTGLNLTGADTVILYDPWWNVAAQDQATDRAHRIGQTKSVQVYKLIVKDTIEEKILKLQELKKGLTEVIEEEKDSEDEGALTAMSADEIISLLKER